MERSVERLTAVLAVVVLAGCAGIVGYAPVTAGTADGTERGTATTTDTNRGGLVVSNARSDSYEVTIQIVDGPVESLNVTYRNGTSRVVSVPERPAAVSPTLIGSYETIRSVEPVNETVTVGKAVGPGTNDRMRFGIEWDSPTLVVVVENRSEEDGGIESVQLLRCEPPDPHFERLRVDIHREAAVEEISLGTRCR